MARQAAALAAEERCDEGDAAWERNFAAGRVLEEAYIERWAAEWRVSDRWDEAKRSLR